MARTKVDAPGRLDGQVAIVTGGGSGIGRATCSALAREGACLAVVDVDKTHVRETRDEIARHAPCPESAKRTLELALDVRREGGMEEMGRQTTAQVGHVDILIASAGNLRAKGSGPELDVDMPTVEWQEGIE